jgi:hypothetical protein
MNRMLTQSDLLFTMGHFMDLASVHRLAQTCKTMRRAVIAAYKWFGVARTVWSDAMPPSYMLVAQFQRLVTAFDTNADSLHTLNTASTVFVHYVVIEDLTDRVDVVAAILNGARNGNTFTVRFVNARIVASGADDVLPKELESVMRVRGCALPLYVVIAGRMAVKHHALADEVDVLDDMQNRFLEHVAGSDSARRQTDQSAYLCHLRDTPLAHRAGMLLCRLAAHLHHDRHPLPFVTLHRTLAAVMHYLKSSKSSTRTATLDTGWFTCGLLSLLNLILSYPVIGSSTDSPFVLQNMARYKYDTVLPFMSELLRKVSGAAYSANTAVHVDDTCTRAVTDTVRAQRMSAYRTANYVPARGRAVTELDSARRHVALEAVRDGYRQLRQSHRRFSRVVVRNRQLPISYVNSVAIDTMLRFQTGIVKDARSIHAPYVAHNIMTNIVVPKLTRMVQNCADGKRCADMVLRVVKAVVLASFSSYDANRDAVLTYVQRSLIRTCFGLVTKYMVSDPARAPTKSYMDMYVYTNSCIGSVNDATAHVIQFTALAVFTRMPRMVLQHHCLELFHLIMQAQNNATDARVKTLVTLGNKFRPAAPALFESVATFYGFVAADT